MRSIAFRPNSHLRQDGLAEPLVIAKAKDTELALLPALANRHGCITGATGTGKTVTLQVMAERFSSIGVPVFMADVKGDLAGISAPGQLNPKIKERLDRLGIPEPKWDACPVTFWDLFGELGHPVRATISDIGPLLFARLLNLNEIQEGVLTLTFKIADDNGLLLLDLKDLRALLQYVGDNAGQFKTQYGNVSAASIGTIQRGLLQIEEQGGDKFFGEPMLNIQDLLQTDSRGHGVVNILAAEKLMNNPRVYASFLLWLLSELFENLPEVGDREKPTIVFFFDEAPQALLEKVELVVRLVRSKGVGVYFVTQNPLDIPDKVLAQLGNRVQHALRAFTPRDQKAVKAVAETMRPNPELNIVEAIMELGVGEALVSLLDEKGTPGITERAFILPPSSQIGAITPEQRSKIIAQSIVAGVYEKTIDRESAYEQLSARAAQSGAASPSAAQPTLGGTDAPATGGALGGVLGAIGGALLGSTGPRGGHHDGLLDLLAKSAMRSVGSGLGRAVVNRGPLGSILGGGRRRRY